VFKPGCLDSGSCRYEAESARTERVLDAKHLDEFLPVIHLGLKINYALHLATQLLYDRRRLLTCAEYVGRSIRSVIE
jgi:hypothetical protein